jgi:Lamin Tail Domain
MRESGKYNWVYRLFTIRVWTTVSWLTIILLPHFTAAQSRYDILITEFLSDPSPSISLPETEFIELTNRSGKEINLRHFIISNGNSSATIKTDFILKPDSMLILCNGSSETAFGQYGSALALSGFPSLNNEEGNIILYSASGNIMHALHYDRSWFHNDLKAGGGWSLEMIDLSNPSGGKENWSASIAEAGGTPGHINSVNASNPDEQPPSLLRAVALDSARVVLFFDEAIDSVAGATADGYLISDGIGQADSAFTIPPFFNRIQIHLPKPLVKNKIYELSVQQILDCSRNEIGLRNHCPTGLMEKADPGDIVFNEILFNPPAFGYDYLELYNRSSKIIPCSELFIAGRDPDGSLKNPVALVEEERGFFPGEYLLLSENPDWVTGNYPSAPAAQLIPITSIPSLPDDQGKCVLLNPAGEILDELDYNHHWHSPLLASEAGVSLERIRTDLPTGLASNWTSASATVGNGTPGYKNSEAWSGDPADHFITIDPDIFSPDMDGYHDFCFVNYQLPASGYTGSISIYDIYGRMVRKLVNNILWGTSGTFRWDGLDEEQNLLPMGHYVIYVELFLPDGTILKKKLVCTLARR